MLITEVFGDFYGAGLIDLIENFEVASAGNIYGGFDVRIEQQPAMMMGPSGLDMLASVVPDDLPVAA